MISLAPDSQYSPSSQPHYLQDSFNKLPMLARRRESDALS